MPETTRYQPVDNSALSPIKEQPHKERRYDLWALYFLSFAGFLDFTITAPSVLPYIETIAGKGSIAHTYLSINSAVFGASQLIAPAAAAWGAKRVGGLTTVFNVLLITAVCGNILYSFAGASNSIALLFIGRLMAGWGTGTIGIGMSYIGATTTLDERMTTVANFRAASGVGACISQAIAYLLTFIDVKVGSWTVNQLNSPALVAAFLLTCALVGVNLFVKRDYASAQQNAAQRTATDVEEGGAVKELRVLRVWTAGTITCLLVFTFNGILSSSMLFFMPILTHDGWGWETARMSNLLLGSYFAMLIASVLIKKTVKFDFIQKRGDWFSVFLHMLLVIVGLVLVMIGAGAGVSATGAASHELGESSYGAKFTFVVGFILIYFGYASENTVAGGVYSKIIPSENQIVMMPLYMTAFAAGNIIGPLWAGLELHVQGWALAMGFVLTAFIVLTCTVYLVRHSLTPYKKAIKSVDNTPLLQESDDSGESGESQPTSGVSTPESASAIQSPEQQSRV
eukprot:GFYU01011039.1.p1 GENE.GFYU01011039.1~~GFYU01011039.1.p1  ORF type:complete len:512 (+),score=147.33 GFYU01011039.1:210-1745(+)